MRFLLIVFSILVVHCFEVSNGDEDNLLSSVAAGPLASLGAQGNSTNLQDIKPSDVELPEVGSPAQIAEPSESKRAPKAKKSSKSSKSAKTSSKKKGKKESTTPTTTTTPEPPPPQGKSQEDENSHSRTSSESKSHSNEEDRPNTGPKPNVSEPLPKKESDPIPEAKISEAGPDGKQNKSEESPPNNLKDPNPTEWDGKSPTERTVMKPVPEDVPQNSLGGPDSQTGPDLEQRIVEGGYGRDRGLVQGSQEDDHNDISPGIGDRYPEGESYHYPNSIGDPNMIPGANRRREGPPSYPDTYRYPPGPGYGGYDEHQQLINPYGQDLSNQISDRLDSQFGHGVPNGPYNSQNGRDPSRHDEDQEHLLVPRPDGKGDGYRGRPDGGRHMLLPPDDKSSSGDRGRREYYDPKYGGDSERPPADEKSNPGKGSNSDNESSSDPDKDSQDNRNGATDYDDYDEEDAESLRDSGKQQENRGKEQSRDDHSKLPDSERQGNNRHNTGDNEVLKPVGDKQHTNMPSRPNTGSLDSKGLPNTKGHKQGSITRYPGDSSNFPNKDAQMYPDQDYGNSGHRNPQETRDRIDNMIAGTRFGYNREKTLWDTLGDLRWQGINGARDFITNPFGMIHGIRDRIEHGYNQFNQGIRGSYNGLYGSGGRYRIPEEVPDDNKPLSWQDFQNPGVLKKIFRYLSEALSKMKGIPARIKEAFKRLASSLSRSNSYE